MAQLSNLICTGVARILSKLYVNDSVTAPKFIGNLQGNADSATKVNGHTVNSDVPSNAKFTDTTYTHPTTSGNKHIPNGGSNGQILKWSSDGTAAWGTETNTWRGIQNNLTSDSTTDSLSAAQGKVLKGSIDTLNESLGEQNKKITNLSNGIKHVEMGTTMERSVTFSKVFENVPTVVLTIKKEQYKFNKNAIFTVLKSVTTTGFAYSVCWMNAEGEGGDADEYVSWIAIG